MAYKKVPAKKTPTMKVIGTVTVTAKIRVRAPSRLALNHYKDNVAEAVENMVNSETHQYAHDVELVYAEVS